MLSMTLIVAGLIFGIIGVIDRASTEGFLMLMVGIGLVTVGIVYRIIEAVHRY